MRNFRLINFLAIFVGAAIMGLTINAINLANHLAEGGLTGISILLKLSLGWDPGLTTMLMNVPLFILGWMVLGRQSLVYTIFGTLSLSMFLWLFGGIRYPMNDLLLDALMAGTGVGLGLGLIFRFGGTTGGVDIIARVLNKYLGWKIGTTMLAADLLVLAMSLVHLSLQQVMYTLVAVFVGSRVIDFVEETAYAARSVMIVSDQAERLAAAIMDEMHRGVTFLRGEGAYTGHLRKVLFVVVGKSEIVRLKNLVLSVDPEAFLTASATSDVLGQGFTLDEHQQPKAAAQKEQPARSTNHGLLRNLPLPTQALCASTKFFGRLNGLRRPSVA